FGPAAGQRGHDDAVGQRQVAELERIEQGGHERCPSVERKLDGDGSAISKTCMGSGGMEIPLTPAGGVTMEGCGSRMRDSASGVRAPGFGPESLNTGDERWRRNC